jgi:ribosomal subunit interface protein
MNVLIAAEHFDLTEAIKKHVELGVERLDGYIAEDGSVRAFLRKEADHQFTVLLKAHVGGVDLVASRTGSDLYLAASGASSQLRRELLKLRRKRILSRRRLRHEYA